MLNYSSDEVSQDNISPAIVYVRLFGYGIIQDLALKRFLHEGDRGFMSVAPCTCSAQGYHVNDWTSSMAICIADFDPFHA